VDVVGLSPPDLVLSLAPPKRKELGEIFEVLGVSDFCAGVVAGIGVEVVAGDEDLASGVLAVSDAFCGSVTGARDFAVGPENRSCILEDLAESAGKVSGTAAVADARSGSWDESDVGGFETAAGFLGISEVEGEAGTFAARDEAVVGSAGGDVAVDKALPTAAVIGIGDAADVSFVAGASVCAGVVSTFAGVVSELAAVELILLIAGMDVTTGYFDD